MEEQLREIAAGLQSVRIKEAGGGTAGSTTGTENALVPLAALILPVLLPILALLPVTLPILPILVLLILVLTLLPVLLPVLLVMRLLLGTPALLLVAPPRPILPVPSWQHHC